MEMIKVGPVGNDCGSIWEENGRGDVAGIFVSYTEDSIQSLQSLFCEDGNFVQSNKHGRHYCANFSALVFNYPSEFLTSISGSCVDVEGLESIEFTTNKGTYGPFGQTTTYAKHFNFHLGNSNLFGGFHGTISDSAVDSIGIYLKPAIINLKDLRLKDEK
ncbi:inactive protein RESTRICTED TEV MOVEMENT 1-like [Solanum pennellii]|uniref:Inactive protein RESTRICTED TEV MOVEMENT 1-like n=1 Tax=Solanum pennellii TaxID=28526 RepID=A0ABM1HIK0_SOLPN|nr:inactive protein RESTRICTED TEV MOVEMENT 1-like [Solanum pennellii]